MFELSISIKKELKLRLYFDYFLLSVLFLKYFNVDNLYAAFICFLPTKYTCFIGHKHV